MALNASALAVAAWLGRRIAAPITRLADAARDLGQREVAGSLKAVEARAGVTEARALAALRRANWGANPASVTLEGDPRMVAGINVKLRGWGAFFDGVYHVASSVHRLSRGEGYVTEPELRKVS